MCCLSGFELLATDSKVPNVFLQVIKAHDGRRVLLPGAVSGPEGAVDDGGHPGWTKDQQGSLPLLVGITEAPQ